MEGVVPGGPACVAGFVVNRSGHLVDLCIQVVNVTDHEGLGGGGQLGRAEFILAVMREDDVRQGIQEHRVDLRAPRAKGLDLLIYHQDALDDVADELAGIGVRKGHVVRKLLGLAHIVKEDAGQHEVALHVGVVRQDGQGDVQHIVDVREQPADVTSDLHVDDLVLPLPSSHQRFQFEKSNTSRFGPADCLNIALMLGKNPPNPDAKGKL